MQTETQSRTPPALPRRRGWRRAAMLYLVALGLTLGAVWNWGLSQRRARIELAAQVRGLRNDHGLILAKREDLGRLLAAPNVELIHLRGRGILSGKTARIAWDASGQAGVLFAQDLPLAPAGQRYHVWVDQIPAGVFDAEPGTTIHAFRPATAVPANAEFLVTIEAPESARPGGPIVLSGPG